MPAEEYLKNYTLLEETARSTDLKSLLNSFNNTVYANALRAGLKKYEEDGSTRFFEIFLDKCYYEKLWDTYQVLPKKEKAHALYYASMDNDSFTLLTILRGKTLNYDANWLKAAIPKNHFKISNKTAEALLAAPDFESTIEIVSKSGYAKFFDKMDTPELIIASAEKAFNKAKFKHAKTSHIKEIFNIGAPLGFMVQKSFEVQNLVAISLGIEAGWKTEKIQRALFLSD